MRVFWVVTLISCVASALIILITLATARGAPQEAAGYAMACAFAIVPYVFTRAAEAIAAPDLRDTVNRIVDSIDRLGPKG